MSFDAEHILSVLDGCCDAFTFPMLDNGYVYLAATRLSLYRAEMDWAMVIEVFGFSPRAGLPDVHIHTFASKLRDRDAPEQFNNRAAYENYLTNNPHNESRFVYPISAGSWLDAEFVAGDATEVVVRDQPMSLPTADQYERCDIELEIPDQIQVFELCRFLAHDMRESVLATEAERRMSVPSEMRQILQLEEWHHPDVVVGDCPSQSETFQQLARVLATGDAALYRPSRSPNTHWRNWPEGGSL